MANEELHMTYGELLAELRDSMDEEIAEVLKELWLKDLIIWFGNPEAKDAFEGLALDRIMDYAREQCLFDD